MTALMSQCFTGQGTQSDQIDSFSSQSRMAGGSVEEGGGLAIKNPLFCKCILLFSGKRMIFPEILGFLTSFGMDLNTHLL